MVEKIVWLKEGFPYFLDEIENGVFHAVKAFRYFTNPGYSEYEYDWDIGKLTIGRDIIEIPNRNVSMLVKCNDEGENVLSEILNECLKLAEISSHDYVSLEPFGSKLGKLIFIEGKTKLIEIRPRFFKKVEKE